MLGAIIKDSLYKGRAISRTGMPTAASVLDDELQQRIRDILKTSGTNMTSMFVRTRYNDGSTDSKFITMKMSQGLRPHGHEITASREEVFHIASLTKPLLATAVVLAIEVKAKEDTLNNPYHKFKDIQGKAVTSLCNLDSKVMVGALPYDPTIYNLLVHALGIHPSNDRILEPGGKVIMTMAEMRDDLLRPAARRSKPWQGYSNINYSVVAMIIEALWDGDDGFDGFMNETLFGPLDMNSTYIGTPDDGVTDNQGCVVDHEGRAHRIQRPQYRADGVESGAFGAYSTAQDLDIFFKFLLDTFYGHQDLPGFDIPTVGILLKMTHEATESLHYTPLGLYTSLRSSTIGELSTNRMQFPNEPFSTYPVLPGPVGDRISVFYNAGTAIGCSCATALHVNKAGSFAIVVLTDTSGPVDSSDHILRLILRKIAMMLYPDDMFEGLSNIEEMVTRAKVVSSQRWKEKVRENEQPSTVAKKITGVFKGDGFSQQLEIVEKDDGKAYITIRGSSAVPLPNQFKLIWVADDAVKICVPPHLSIDCLDTGDWSNLIFKVEAEGGIVKRLIRKTVMGDVIREDRYLLSQETNA